jgi:predicted ATPase
LEKDVDAKAIKGFRDFVEINALYSVIAHEELRSLSFYHLNPESLRKRSSTSSPPYLAPDGSNLPATLARIKAEDPLAFQFISHDITSLVSDVLSIDVEKYDAIGEYGIRVTTSDKRMFTAQALSDGTLRLLALATLRNDPQFQGTICIEEPENGVQPLYLKQFARLLHDMATDFADPEHAEEPLRQVIVTTHSPTFICQPEVIDHLLLATMPTRVSPETQSLLSVTRMEPVMTPETLAKISSDEDRASKYYTIDIVRQYLDSGTLQQADEWLKQARSDLQKM